MLKSQTGEANVTFLNYYYFLRLFHSVAQAGMQWRHHGSLQPQSSTSASQVAGTTSAHHHTWIIFKFIVEVESHHHAQADLELWAQAIFLP